MGAQKALTTDQKYMEERQDCNSPWLWLSSRKAHAYLNKPRSADWMTETATMVKGVALLYGMDVGDLIRDALKVWLQKRAEEEENRE